MNTTSNMIVGIDIGGTKITCGLVNLAQVKIVKSVTEKTNLQRGLDGLVAQITSLVLKVQGSQKAPVGIACPGLVDFQKQQVVYAVNLPFKNTALPNLLATSLGKNVVIENDIKAASIGELNYGLGKTVDTFVTMSVGTGIGGAAIIDRRLLRGESNIAGEVGHLSIDFDGSVCSCGNSGCLDNYASGRAISIAANDIAKKKKRSNLGRIYKDTGSVDAKDVFDLARRSDPDAVGLVKTVVSSLSAAIVNVAQVIQPRLFILTGSVIIKNHDLLMDPIRKIVKQRLFRPSLIPGPKILCSKLGANAALLGAALVASQKYA